MLPVCTMLSQKNPNPFFHNNGLISVCVYQSGAVRATSDSYLLKSQVLWNFPVRSSWPTDPQNTLLPHSKLKQCNMLQVSIWSISHNPPRTPQYESFHNPFLPPFPLIFVWALTKPPPSVLLFLPPSPFNSSHFSLPSISLCSPYPILLLFSQPFLLLIILGLLSYLLLIMPHFYPYSPPSSFSFTVSSNFPKHTFNYSIDKILFLPLPQ